MSLPGKASALAALITAAAVAAPSANAVGGGRNTAPRELDRLSPATIRWNPTTTDLQRALAATLRFRSVQQALAAGYLAPPECVVSPFGGMGYHFENPALMEDAVLDPTRPEMLMYERGPNGQLVLIGLEYYMEADQTTTAPVPFGQTFEGPMEAHHPGMEEHYDLHVWLYKHNPSGLFAMWNPDVTCP